VKADSPVAKHSKINPLEPKLAKIIFNNSVSSAKKTLIFTIALINLLTLFKKIIPVYTENHTKHKKFRLIDCQSRWDIYLATRFKGLRWSDKPSVYRGLSSQFRRNILRRIFGK
jgi:hypothetical protein